MKALPKPDKFQTAVISLVAAMVLARQYLAMVVAAVAGSGKTTLLQQICQAAPSDRSILFLAYNTTIAAEARIKLRHLNNVWVKTVHSHGKSACTYRWRRTEVDPDKGFEISKRLTYDAIDDGYVGQTVVSRNDRLLLKEKKPTYLLKKILELVRSNLIDERNPEDVLAMLDHFGMYLDDHEWRFIKVALPLAVDECIKQAPLKIDFADMIFLPHRLDLSVYRNDIVLVDECQDLSPARLDIAVKSVKSNGQIIFVGDARQAIYGFSGADARSIDTIIDRTGATTLPLSICYRCDQAMVKLAQTIEPTIEWRPGAPEGKITEIGDADITSHVAPGDLVICRTNAPMIALAYRMLADGVPTKIMGTDIGQGLINIITKITERTGYRWSEFGHHLTEWLCEQTQGILRRNGGNEEDGAIARLQDRVSCVRVLAGKSEFSSADDVIGFIKTLFSKDDDLRYVRCSSVHRAKGLEADRVFILYADDLMPHPMARQAWEREQESNLMYVAYTRAKHETFFVCEGSTEDTSDDDGTSQDTTPDSSDSPSQADAASTSTNQVEAPAPKRTLTRICEADVLADLFMADIVTA